MTSSLGEGSSDPLCLFTGFCGLAKHRDSMIFVPQVQHWRCSYADEFKEQQMYESGWFFRIVGTVWQYRATI